MRTLLYFSVERSFVDDAVFSSLVAPRNALPEGTTEPQKQRRLFGKALFRILDCLPHRPTTALTLP